MPYEKVGDGEPICIADEVPFEIPESWEWSRLGCISNYDGRKMKVNAQKVSPSTWGLDLEDIEKGGRIIERKTVGEHKAVGEKTVFCCGDILYSKLRPYLLKILVAPYDGICTSEIVPFSVYGGISADYIVSYLKSPYVDGLINSITYGIKMPRVGTETMVGLLVPIPPLDEQRRICAKIIELEPHIDDYACAEQANVSINLTFPDMLKKSILQMAVQGKLVPQDPADEPAEALLARIREQKAQLIREGKIKRDKHESIIFRRDNSHYEMVDGVERCIDDEIPFEIPESWAWCRLNTLVEMITSGSRDWAQFYSTSGAKFLRMGNLSRNSFSMRLASIQHVSLPKAAEGMRTSLQAGDLLFSITGDVGLLGLIPEQFGEAYINQHTAMIRFMPMLKGKYLPYVLLSDYAQKQYKSNQHGIKNSFRLDSIGELLVPVPPIKEQVRVVSAIEQMNGVVNTM